MKMKNILWLPLVISLLMVACTDKEIEENITPRDGEEVAFLVKADNGKSRTLYGDEATDGKSIVVNWVKGDKVLVYGTDCSNPSAEYKVPDTAHGQNFAGQLEKTGAAGVQWGTATTSDFYSVYPSNSVIEPYTVENNKVTSVKVTTEIRQIQNVSFKKETKNEVVTYVGTHYNGDVSNPTMTDAVMYAVTTGAEAGKPVNLKYNPFSNVFRFTFNGFDIKLSSDALQGDVDNVAYVRQIKVTAPFAISGDFPMLISNDGEAIVDEESINQKIKEEEDNNIVTTRNTVIITPDYLPLGTNESVQFDVFTIPMEYDLSSSNYFIVTIETSNFGSFTYHMKPTVVTDNANKVLAGKMHKVTIPKKTVEHAVTVPMDSWMKFIPRNVYLSELSVPGAWYCMDSGYQGSIGLGTENTDGIDKGLQALYDAGVRAFNIDCRVSRNEFRSIAIGSNPWKDSNYTNGEYHFACSGTENPTTVTAYVQMKEGVHVLEAVKDIVSLAQNNPYEIISIIFTFAEKPCTEKGGTSTKVYGTVNPVFITNELKKVLEDSNVAPYIYKNIDSNTTLGDIISSGKNIIVKINHSNNSFYDNTNFTMPSGIMASYASMAMNDYMPDNITPLDADYYTKMQTSPIYNGTTANGMTYYYCQAQNTYESVSDGTPSIEQRESAISAVLSKAKEVYVNSNHNALFQLGIGGTLNGEDQLTIAKELNPYVQGQIEEMLKSSDNLSPLGFVLMNYCLDEDYGLPLINDVFKFNTKFYLNRDTSKEEWPDDCGGNAFEELYGSEW